MVLLLRFLRESERERESKKRGGRSERQNPVLLISRLFVENIFVHFFHNDDDDDGEQSNVLPFSVLHSQNNCDLLRMVFLNAWLL